MNLVERKFLIGDVVSLKSGSPRLTVVGYTMNGVSVEWIAYNTGVPHTAVYPASCLELSDRRLAP